MKSQISVCIPTFNRPEFLKEAIGSCLSQDLLPDEILVGDDSHDDRSRCVVDSFSNEVEIRYWRNSPSLGQARNVQHLIQNAKCDFISLIHDDDRFRQGAFARPITPFTEHPEVIATFGKQMIISEMGIEDLMASQTLNTYFNRTSDTAGVVRDSFEAGALSMFPNNGYLIRREFASRIDYYDDNIASKACDFYFGLRLGKMGHPFFFVDEYTADYRITAGSIARSGTDAGYHAFRILINELSRSKVTPALDDHLRSKVKVAIAEGARLDRRKAWQWYFSKWHLRSILSLGGISRLLMLLKP